MPNPALSDQLALQQLFQEPFSPLATYGQGSLAIAMQQRQERARAAQQAQEQQFQLQRDQSQSALVMAREQEIEKMRQAAENRKADRAVSDYKLKLQAELDTLSADAKAKKLVELKNKAAAKGITLPADATEEQIVATISKANGQQLIAAAKNLHETLGAYAQAKGQTMQQVYRDAMAQAIANDPNTDPKKLKEAGLTPLDLEAMKDVTQSHDIIQRLAKTNPKGYNLAIKLGASASSLMYSDMNLMEKSKMLQEDYANRFKAANETYQTFLKTEDMLPASDVQTALKMFAQAAIPDQPQGRGQMPRGFGSAPTPRNVQPLPMPGTPPPAVIPPGQFRGIVPMAIGAAGSVGSALGQAAQPVMAAGGAAARDVLTAIGGGDWSNPFAAAASAATPPSPVSVTSGGPAVPFPPAIGTPTVVPPSELARRKLMQQIQESNTYNALLFPQQTNQMLLENP